MILVCFRAERTWDEICISETNCDIAVNLRKVNLTTKQDKLAFHVKRNLLCSFKKAQMVANSQTSILEINTSFFFLFIVNKTDNKTGEPKKPKATGKREWLFADDTLKCSNGWIKLVDSTDISMFWWLLLIVYTHTTASGCIFDFKKLILSIVLSSKPNFCP